MELAEFVYGKKYSSDVARRMMYGSRYTLDLIENEELVNITDEEALERLAKKEIDIEKKLVKFRDYRNLVNENIRTIARSENLKDIANDYAELMCEHFPIQFDNYIEKSYNNNSAILMISDWHFGIDIDNYLNKYNLEVFKDRIKQLVTKTIDKIKLHKVNKLYVLNLNDLCSGIIHTNIRLQNRENIIQQVMIVSEALAEMLSELSQYVDIEYYSTIDNHSRCIADKKQSLDKENYSLIIDWFLKSRLKDINNIVICENEFDEETVTFKVYDWNYIAVHGHKDSITNVVQNLSLMTKRFYNACFTAHLHHSHSDEVHGTYIYSNGCLSGVDAHSKDLRKTSNPSQTLIIVTPEDCADSVCTIKLN